MKNVNNNINLNKNNSKLQKFSNFKQFKDYIISNDNKVEKVFRSKNVSRTANIQYQNSKRTASFLREKAFIKIFKTDETLFPKKDEIKDKCITARNEAVEQLSKSRKLKLKSSLVKKSFAKMAEMLKLTGKKFSPVSILESLDFLPTKTSSGYPDHVTPKKDNHNVILQQFHSLLEGAELNLRNLLVYVSWRTQMRKGPKLKFRQFFPFPQLIQAIEGIFAVPFFKHFDKNKDLSYCYGNVFTDLRPRIKHWNTRRFIYSLDFKGFDLSVQNYLIKTVFFGFIKHFLLINNSIINKLYLMVIDFHCHCSIVTSIDGDTCVMQKESGLMSGSVMTGFCGSIINLFTSVYFCLDHEIEIETFDINVLGDDNIMALNRQFSLEYLQEYFANTFGLIISIEKSEIFKPFEKIFFLGHYIDINGRYLDWQLAKYQLSYAENYIPENVMSTDLRLFSKFCSICVKCTDGHLFYQKYIDQLRPLLSSSSLPTSFKIMFYHERSLPADCPVSAIFENGWEQC